MKIYVTTSRTGAVKWGFDYRSQNAVNRQEYHWIKVHWVKSEEVNYLYANIILLQIQLARYELAPSEVNDYVEYASNSTSFMQPDNDSCPFILYDVLYDEVTGNIV